MDSRRRLATHKNSILTTGCKGGSRRAVDCREKRRNGNRIVRRPVDLVHNCVLQPSCSEAPLVQRTRVPHSQRCCDFPLHILDVAGAHPCAGGVRGRAPNAAGQTLQCKRDTAKH